MDFIDRIINCWLTEYKIQRNLDYEVAEKDRKAVGLMLKRAKELNPDDNSEAILKKFENLFKQALAIKDDFINKNMTLPFLNSQINKIKVEIQKQKTRNNIQSYKPLSEQEFKKVFPGAELVGVFNFKTPLGKNIGKPMTKSEYVKKYGWARVNEYKEYLSKFEETA
jgi:hypothetical protein